MSGVLQLVKAFFDREISESKTGKILVCLSGGPDSVTLLSVLHALGHTIGAAHVNFGLREEADAEEQLVRDLCTQLEVPLRVKRADPGEIKAMEGSVQMAAREFRYTFFRSVAKADGFAWIATAHHQDDQVETLLYSLLKGGAPGILSGIPPRIGCFIRPMIGVEKAALMEYLKDNALPYALDASNRERDYLRNQIRLDVLPQLRQINPGIGRRMMKLKKQLSLRQAYLEDALLTDPGVVPTQEKGWELNFETMETPKRFWPLVLEQVLLQMGFWGLEIEQALPLLQSDVGKGKAFRQGHVLRTSSGMVIRPAQIRIQEQGRILKERLEIERSQFASGFKCNWKGGYLVEGWLTSREDAVPALHEKGVYYMDATAIQFPVTFRCWEKGDRMQPLGMRGRRKLSDILSEMGIDRIARQDVLVVADVDQILLVDGYRIADPVRMSEESASLLAIRTTKVNFQAPDEDVRA